MDSGTGCFIAVVAIVIIVIVYYLTRFIDNTIGYNVLMMIFSFGLVGSGGVYIYDVYAEYKGRRDSIQALEQQNIQLESDSGLEKLALALTAIRQHLEAVERDQAHRPMHLSALADSVDRMLQDKTAMAAVKSIRDDSDNEHMINLTTIIEHMDDLGLGQHIEARRLRKIFASKKEFPIWEGKTNDAGSI